MMTFWKSKEGEEFLRKVEMIGEASRFDPAAMILQLKSKKSGLEFHQIQEAVEIVLGRRKANDLGSWTAHGFFSRQSLQQSTHPRISSYHAKPFSGCQHILEVCAGLGFDTAALAKNVGRVTSIERDPQIAAMARENLALQGVHNVEILVGDAREITPQLSTRFDGLWADPSRRDESGERVGNPEDYQPPLSFLFQLDMRGPRGIKISPSVNLAELPTGWSKEWIGLGKECREQILWSGVEEQPLIALPEMDIAWKRSSDEDAEVLPRSFFENRGCYLVEPHPVLIRSGSLEGFYRENGISLIDPHIAYGVSLTEPRCSPWLTRFHCIDFIAFHRKAVDERLARLHWGKRTEIKKRGFLLEPDEIRRQLHFPSDGQPGGVLLFTRIGNGHGVFFAHRMEKE